MTILSLLTVALLSLPSAVAAADEPARALAFKAGEGGEFLFDTGVLRGKLRPRGKTIGLASVVHIRSGAMLDQGDAGYGLFSHYRVFSTGQRYGGGAWDWPSTARLREDGAVEVRWAAGEKRPFQMRAIYRWTAADTLDLETSVQAEADLPAFESFLASYFRQEWTNCMAWVSQPASKPDQPGFMATEKAGGDWQMFPREEAALKILGDGRWKLPPNPVDWKVQPMLARPIAIRRSLARGLTAALMARRADCFAIAAPQQAEGHYSLYLSLFGKDLKAGETARAHARMLVLDSFAEQKILDSQRELEEAHP